LYATHSVDEISLMPIFDQYCFSFVFLGLPKIGDNRYTLDSFCMVASLLIVGYDATASSNWENFNVFAY